MESRRRAYRRRAASAMEHEDNLRQREVLVVTLSNTEELKIQTHH